MSSLLRVSVLLLSLCFAHPALASTPISGTIPENTTWTKADSPYVVSNVIIPAGTTLTIEPGVVVKMRSYGESDPLRVLGTLTIGTADATEQVVFTSLADDLVGGDTNGDENATSPNPGDWRNITAEEGGVVRAYHTTFRYGGANTGYDYSCIGYCEYKTYASSQVFNHGGAVEVSDSSFTRSFSAQFAQSSGASTLRHSNFLNAPRGLSTTGGTVISDHNAFSNTSTGMSIGATTISVLSNTFTNTPRNSFVLNGSSYTSDGRNTSDGSSFLLSGDVEGTLLFPAEGFTYVMGSTRIAPTGTLSFSSGAVLKITPEVNILVEGMLSIGSSTAPQWSLVTSLKDDDVGGDTNGDGATLPAQGDWRNIRIESGGTLQVAHAAFRYGGAPVGYDYVCHGYCGYTYYASGQVFNHGGSLLVDDSRFSDAYAHIYVHGGTSTITHTELIRARYRTIDVVSGDLSLTESSLHDTSGGSQGLNVLDGATVNATTDWWGDASGPTHSTNASGTGVLINGSATFTPWLTSAPDLAAPTFMDPSVFVPEEEGCVTKCYSNVLFLPGLEASRMYRTARIDEPGTETRLWEPSYDSIVRDLFLDIDGKQPIPSIFPYTRDVVDVAYVDNIGNIYKTFLSDLESWKNTEHIIADYAVVPYDWRFSPQDIIASGIKTGNNISYIGTSPNPYIKSELARLVASSRTGKVTIIAHSYGGLVAKMLLKQLEDEGDPLLSKVDNLILVASPQVGTPQAMGGLLYGYEQGIPKSLPGPIQKLTETTAREFGENLPGAYTLLPSGMYFSSVHDINHPLISFDNSTAFTQERLHYGNMVGNLNELYDYLLGAEGREKPFPEILSRANVLNPNILGIAHETHVKIDGWIPPATMQLHQIAGWGEETLAGIKYQSIPVVNGFGTTEIHTPDLVLDGDGTVLVPSALWVSTSTENVHRWWVNLIEYNKLNTGRDHASILEVTDIRKFIKENILTRTAIASPVFIKDFSPSSEDLPKHLNYFLHSPLSLSAYDDNGNEISSATSTIPGARYREFGEVKYISVPASAPHHLVLDGYATGEFTLEVQEVQGDTIGATTTFVAIPTSTTTNVTMDFTDGTIEHASPLRIDEDGNGTTDLSLVPKVGEVIFVTPLDSTPPTTTASTTGTLGTNTWYTSNVTVELIATDTDSGVASTTYSLDNGVSWIAYTTPFTITTEGSTIILYASTDTTGNMEATTTLTLQIDKTAPEAMISVSTSTQDLLVEGKDTLGTTTITKDTAGNYTLTDQAGHTTTLFFTKTYSGKRLTYAKLTGVQYDGGIKKLLPSSSFVYLWDIKTSTSLISQTIAVDGTYVIQAVYDKTRNKTTVLVLKKSTPVKTQVFQGLRIPKLTTSNGVIGYSL